MTGNSDTADYKDVVLADFGSKMSLSSCGMLTVTKVTDPAGRTDGDFTCTLTRSGGGDLNFAPDGYTNLTSVSATRTGAGAFPGNPVIDLRAATDYTLSETIAGMYDHVSTVCTVGGRDYTVTPTSTFPIVVGETTR